MCVGVQRCYSPFHVLRHVIFPPWRRLSPPLLRCSTGSYVTLDISLTISENQPGRKFELLNRAVQTHTRLTREAATGKGIDRHLLGLRLLMKAEDGETADLFSDELFQRSQTWKLSTSGLSAGYQFRGTGFGAPYSDGYGINCEWWFVFLRFSPSIRHETGNKRR